MFAWDGFGRYRILTLREGRGAVLIAVCEQITVARVLIEHNAIVKAIVHPPMTGISASGSQPINSTSNSGSQPPPRASTAGSARACFRASEREVVPKAGRLARYE